jgi:hypothetical protein
VAFGALLVGGIALGSGCSSSNSNNRSGSSSSATNETSEAGILHRGDASSTNVTTPDTGSSTGGGQYDGTVGQPCTSDADCQPAGGAGVNICSSSLSSGVLFPTPVCVLTTCDPGTDGQLHFCDGPDAPTSPGACLAIGQGEDLCLPQCQLLIDGKAPQGCSAGSACAQLAVGVDQAGDVAGAFGVCLSACVKDADCPTGTSCQTDTGSCVTKIVTASKAPGAACTDADSTSGACPCFIGNLPDGGVTGGVCAPACVTGPTAACPSGFVCDGFLQTSIVATNGSTLAGFTLPNPGLVGRCFQACTAISVDSGTSATDAAAADAATAGACPATSTCTTIETSGADCLPM